MTVLTLFYVDANARPQGHRHLLARPPGIFCCAKTLGLGTHFGAKAPGCPGGGMVTGQIDTYIVPPRKLTLEGLPQAPYLLTDLQKAHFVEDEQKDTTFKVQVHTFNFCNILSAYAQHFLVSSRYPSQFLNNQSGRSYMVKRNSQKSVAFLSIVTMS